MYREKRGIGRLPLGGGAAGDGACAACWYEGIKSYCMRGVVIRVCSEKTTFIFFPHCAHMHTHAYLDAVQQFAHAPEAVSLDVPQSLFLETGHVKVFHFLLWRRQKENRERKRVRNKQCTDSKTGERQIGGKVKER